MKKSLLVLAAMVATLGLSACEKKTEVVVPTPEVQPAPAPVVVTPPAPEPAPAPVIVTPPAEPASGPDKKPGGLVLSE